MHCASGEQTIVCAHHMEARFERRSVMFYAHAAIQIVDHNSMDGTQNEAFLLGHFHHTDAPIHVGREAKLQAIRRALCKVCAGIKGLMAHQHAPFEVAPRQVFGRHEAAMAQKMPRVVHNIGVAIEHTGQHFALANSTGHLLKGVGLGKGVAGIEKQHIIARGALQSFVHRVIEPFVGLRAVNRAVKCFGLRALCSDIRLDERGGLVARCTIYEHMFYMRIGLLRHTFEGALNFFFGLKRAGDNRKFNNR